MRRIQLAAAAVAIAASAAVAAPATAQGVHEAMRPTYAATAHFSDAQRDSLAVARARELSERADRRWHAYDLAGARRDFQLAAELLRARNLYAGPTLVSLANVTYATDTPAKAARVLLDAAEEAATYGDIAVQANSLFEASVLFQQAGDEGQSTRALESACKLLQSPYLPQDVKSAIERRIKA